MENPAIFFLFFNNENSAEYGVSPVSLLSQNRAKHKNSTKVYTDTNNTWARLFKTNDIVS